MKTILFATTLLAILFMSYGCRKKTAEVSEVKIVDIPRLSKQNMAGVNVECDTFYIDPGVTIGGVIDMTYSDSCFYILDDQGQIIVMHANGKKDVRVMKRIGQGPDEYINPSNIHVDRDTLYLLDSGGSSIKRYGTDFSFISTIELDFIANGLIAKDGNILVGNLDMKQDNHEIKAIDPSGKKHAYIEGDGILPEYLVANTQFSQKDDSIFISSRNSNNIYKYINGIVSPYMLVDFKDGFSKIPEPGKPMLTHLFRIQDLTVLSCLIDGERTYVIIDGVTGGIYSGKITETTNDHPFYPRWSTRDGLLLGYEPAEDDGNGCILSYKLNIRNQDN